jgi:hypothetical protein
MRLPCGSFELLDRLAAFADSARSARFTSISLALVSQARRVHGGRGRIRTSVARKERQIYSLLVLATHPPVLENPFWCQLLFQQIVTKKFIRERAGRQAKTQNGLVSRDTSPSFFSSGFALPNPPRAKTSGAGGGN